MRGTPRNVDKDPGWVERRFRNVEDRLSRLSTDKLDVVPDAVITIDQALTNPNVGAAYVDTDSAEASADDVSVTLVLSYQPIADSLNVYQNGLRLRPSEYVRADNIVTIPPSAEVTLRTGDEFNAWYVRDTTAPDPAVVESSAYDAAVLAEPTLLGYWRLAESSGLVMEDSSGNGRHGTYSAGVELGAAALLDGDPDTSAHFPSAFAPHGVVPHGAWMNVSTFTAEAWIATDALSGGIQYIVNRDTQGRSWMLRVDSGGNLRSEVVGGGSSVATADLDDTNVYYVAVTYDGTNLRLYINGALVQTTASSAPPSVTADLAIGATYAGDVTWWNAYYFKGRIGKVAFYAGAQSDAAILNRYEIGSGA